MVDPRVIDTLIAEAGGDEAGLRAVAATISNRSSAWGKTPAQIVAQKNQYTGYSKPGSKAVAAQKDAKVRAKAEKAWNDITSGRVPDPTGGGLNYRADYAANGLGKSPYGTKSIGGNTFQLGNGALDAINSAVPLPRTRPSELASAYTSALSPGISSAIPSAAQFGNRIPNPGSVTRDQITPTSGQDYGSDPSIYGNNALQMNRLMLPAGDSDPIGSGPQGLSAQVTGRNSPIGAFPSGASAGIGGRSNLVAPSPVSRPMSLMPSFAGASVGGNVSRGAFDGANAGINGSGSGLVSRQVNTVPIDPMTGNPIQQPRQTLADLLPGYAARQAPSAIQQNGGSIRTIGQAGNVGLPPGVVPRSVQDPFAGAMSGIGSNAQQAPFVPPAVPRPMIPGPSGSLVADKDLSRLGGVATQTQPFAYGGPAPVAPPVAAIQAATMPPLPIPRPSTAPQADAYTVRQGDTLGAIAGRFGTTIDAIAGINDIANPNRIYAGQRLSLQGQGAPVPRNRPSSLSQLVAAASGGGGNGGGGQRSIPISLPQSNQPKYANSTAPGTWNRQEGRWN